MHGGVIAFEAGTITRLAWLSISALAVASILAGLLAGYGMPRGERSVRIEEALALIEEATA